MRTVDLHYGAATHVGNVRKVNEDSHLVAPPVFVVADGMGGHAGGDVASRFVVEEFALLEGATHDARSGSDAILATLARIQARILDYSAAQGGGPGSWHAGTTAVVALLVRDESGPAWLLANLGDSRIYRISDRRLAQVSVDHSVVQELIDAGEITAQQAEHHPEKHVITRALGGPHGVSPDFFVLPLATVDRLFLCSDGISGMIDDAAIEGVLLDAEDPRDAADRVVNAALDAGGRDNATAVVVDVMGLATGDYDSAQQRVSLETKLGALS